MRHQTSTDDQIFSCAFEAFKIPPDQFDHAAHVRLAYVYLCEHSVDAAAGKMKTSLLAFLNHLGVGAARYHETVTRSWILAVSHFMSLSEPCTSSAEFSSRNARLLDSRIMLTHYSAEVLFSPMARQSFVTPDIQAIPEHA